MELRKAIFRLFYGSRLPTNSGSIHIPNLSRDVNIHRDKFGVTYIKAENDHDAWFALGFCHAQDRAFQIENYVRIVRGTLAEITGASGIPVDRLSRRIGFYRAAIEQLPHLEHEVREMLEAYAQGVDAGMMLGCRKPAHEFALMDICPSEFTAADSLGLLKLMSFSLASNWDVELARLMILEGDGPKALEDLDPTYPHWMRVTAPPTDIAGKAQKILAEDLTILLKTSGWHPGGSNCWAISPHRTITGRAILANDPHLAPVMPPHWYLAHMKTPEWSVAGASFVGTPCFPTGHNEQIAWGMTAGLLDNTDLFLEEMSPGGDSVREGNSYVPCEKRVETINVRGGLPIKEDILITSRGPIIGPVLDGEIGAISIQAMWLKSGPLKGLFCVHRTETFDEFRKCFDQWPLLPLNMVYADVKGNIGWQLTGEAPQRRKGWGTIPLSGSDLEVGWESIPVDFLKMPNLQNPEAEFIASANNQPTPDIHDPYLGIDWTDGYRVTRIAEMLGDRSNWDIKESQSMQIDQVSIPWREISKVLLSIPVNNDQSKLALHILQAWDGRVALDSIGASVFEFFLDDMIQRVARARAPNSYIYALGKCFTPLAPNSMFIGRRVSHLTNLINQQPEGWFTTSWIRELEESLTASVSTLQERYGPDIYKWTWGGIRQLTLQHPLSYKKYFGQVFTLGPIGWGGDINTISQAEYAVGNPTCNPTSFASLRVVYDVGNWEESKFALPGGQSGNPLSPHYSDQFQLWQRGEGIPIAWEAYKIERVSISKLCLLAEPPK